MVKHRLVLDKFFLFFLRFNLLLNQGGYLARQGLGLQDFSLFIPARGIVLKGSGRLPLNAGFRHAHYLIGNAVGLLLVFVVRCADAQFGLKGNVFPARGATAATSATGFPLQQRGGRNQRGKGINGLGRRHAGRGLPFSTGSKWLRCSQSTHLSAAVRSLFSVVFPGDGNVEAYHSAGLVSDTLS